MSLIESGSQIAPEAAPRHAETPAFAWPPLDAFWGLPSPADLDDLSRFNLPAAAVQPMLRAFRHVNTAADTLFYDVGVLWMRLYTKGILLSTRMNGADFDPRDCLAALQATANIINLSAVANPEGVILVVDAHQPPFLRRHTDVKDFLAHGLTFPSPDDGEVLHATPKPIEIMAITGVGSSALGSAAFAWNVSEALHKPVAAIVPGYGVADILPQALGGWFGFGLHDYLRRTLQEVLAAAAPELARAGHHLACTAPSAQARLDGAPVFRSGSPESDVLHDILANAPQIKRVYGHSKGALCIQNAIRGLAPERTADLHVTTFGCVIQEETGADYNQELGTIDGLGQLNSWGNWPERWLNAWHSTNSLLPAAMPISTLVQQDVRDEDPVRVDPEQLRDALTEALKTLMAGQSAIVPPAPQAH